MGTIRNDAPPSNPLLQLSNIGVVAVTLTRDIGGEIARVTLEQGRVVFHISGCPPDIVARIQSGLVTVNAKDVVERLNDVSGIVRSVRRPGGAR